MKVTTQFKKETGLLLNTLMAQYNIKGKDETWEKAFKDIFKSNLYILINNHSTKN